MFDYNSFIDRYKNQWERWYNQHVEGQAAGWANNPNVARNSVWKTSDFYNNMMKALPGARNQWYQQNGWIQTNPGQWTLDQRGLQPNGQPLPQQPSPQVIAGRQQLGSIADQLQAANDKASAFVKPATPGMIGKPPVAPINYVDSNRLEAGKGFSKFQRQARGTDRYSIVKQLIDQYYK